MAIEASQFTEKDQLIAKFYTLRAGLSVIAEKTEKIKVTEKYLSDLNAKNDENNKKVQDDVISEINYYKREIERYKNPTHNNPTPSYLIERRIAGYQQELEKVEEHKAKLSHTLLPAIATVVACALVAGICLANGMDFFGAAATISMYILPFIAGSKWRRHKTEQERERLRAPIYEKLVKEKKELEKAQKTEKAALAQLTAEYAALDPTAKDKMDIYKGNIEEWETKLNTEIIPACTSAAQAVQNAMLETGNGIITEADWANLDLLIFYLETGRADSLKEALQLVDKQRQTDQIVHALYEASSYVVRTLGERLDKLSSLVQTGFAQLATQIQHNHNETMSTMKTAFSSLEDVISEGNREISRRLGDIQATIISEGTKIASAEMLNAALLRKANDSSDKLMYELRYNQKYWDK